MTLPPEKLTDDQQEKLNGMVGRIQSGEIANFEVM